MEALRFTAVAVLGVTLDIAIAYSLAQFFAVPLWAAAAIGFFAAAIANYTAHELWTFRSKTSKFSLKRASQYILASAATLTVRLSVIVMLGQWLGADYNLLVLVVATGVSFTLNFILSKFFVFYRQHDQDAPVP